MPTTTRSKSVAPPPSRKPIIPNWLITLVVLSVMVIWVTTIFYSATHPEWPVPASVHAVVIAVVTGLMGYLTMKSRINGNGAK